MLLQIYSDKTAGKMKPGSFCDVSGTRFAAEFLLEPSSKAYSQ